MALKNWPNLCFFVWHFVPIAEPEYMDHLLAIQWELHMSDFDHVDAWFYYSQVASHWCSYVTPLGVDFYLKYLRHIEQTRLLTGFATRNRTGFYSRGQQVKARTVAVALTAIDQAIALDSTINPPKVCRSGKNLPHIQQMLNDWEKKDPPMKKMIPVEADVPENIVSLSLLSMTTSLDKAIGGLSLITLYYLLHVGEYMCKGK
jgi:hypothetical protein